MTGLIHCSFCDHTGNRSVRIFAGPVLTLGGESQVLAICSGCVEVCVDEMAETERQQKARRRRWKLTCEVTS